MGNPSNFRKAYRVLQDLEEQHLALTNRIQAYLGYGEKGLRGERNFYSLESIYFAIRMERLEIASTRARFEEILLRDALRSEFESNGVTEEQIMEKINAEQELASTYLTPIVLPT